VRCTRIPYSNQPMVMDHGVVVSKQAGSDRALSAYVVVVAICVRGTGYSVYLVAAR